VSVAGVTNYTLPKELWKSYGALGASLAQASRRHYERLGAFVNCTSRRTQEWFKNGLWMDQEGLVKLPKYSM